jgi:hypothetical protein
MENASAARPSAGQFPAECTWCWPANHKPVSADRRYVLRNPTGFTKTSTFHEWTSDIGNDEAFADRRFFRTELVDGNVSLPLAPRCPQISLRAGTRFGLNLLDNGNPIERGKYYRRKGSQLLQSPYAGLIPDDSYHPSVTHNVNLLPIERQV